MNDDIWQEIKSNLSIVRVASRLGYQVDRKAGINGEYLEMKLMGNDGHKLDTIVIGKVTERRQHETYFHRNGSKGGSVIDFIKENFHQLGYTGAEGNKDVIKVYHNFMGTPEPERVKVIRSCSPEATKSFDASLFEIRPAKDDMDVVRQICCDRGITDETLQLFAPWMDLVRYKEKMKHPNLGFPYRAPGKEEIVGYELRGYNGVKLKAAGTNSTTAVWIVDMTGNGNPNDARKVYFAESAYDIMAMVQHNREKINLSQSVFVSCGGQLSNQQVALTMKHYSRAKAVDCFDNDLSGRLYGITMAALVSGIHLQTVKTPNAILFNANGKEFSIPHEKVSMLEFSKHMPISKRYAKGMAPSNFKDWNDVIMGKPIKEDITPSKYERDQKLEERRKHKRGLGL